MLFRSRWSATTEIYTLSLHDALPIQAKGIDPDIVVEPARIEQVQELALQREADLRGALKNTGPAGPNPAAPPAGAAPKPATPPGPSSNAAPATPGAAPAADLPPGAKPLPQPGTVGLDAAAFGTDQDYQFVRAVDLLRGVTLFKNMAAAQ